jgi:hypothetical protein
VPSTTVAAQRITTNAARALPAGADWIELQAERLLAVDDNGDGRHYRFIAYVAGRRYRTYAYVSDLRGEQALLYSPTGSRAAQSASPSGSCLPRLGCPGRG